MGEGRPEGYDWDDDKAALNDANHGVTFQEATRIFSGIVYNRVDERFHYGETREISIGYVGALAILTVAHTDRDGIIRIISARKATRTERRLLNEHIKRTFG